MPSKSLKNADRVSLTRELKKNTDVLDFSFEKANLKVINFSYSINDNDRLSFYLEVSSLNDEKRETSFRIKLNLYDSNNDVICQNDHFIDSDFNGYDTFEFFFAWDKNALHACKARLFCTRN